MHCKSENSRHKLHWINYFCTELSLFWYVIYRKENKKQKNIPLSARQNQVIVWCITGSQITRAASIWITSIISDQNNYCTPFSSVATLLHPFSFWMGMESNILGRKVAKFGTQWLWLPFISLEFLLLLQISLEIWPVVLF